MGIGQTSDPQSTACTTMAQVAKASTGEETILGQVLLPAIPAHFIPSPEDPAPVSNWQNPEGIVK